MVNVVFQLIAAEHPVNAQGTYCPENNCGGLFLGRAVAVMLASRFGLKITWWLVVGIDLGT